jgi:hypothetical protein
MPNDEGTNEIELTFVIHGALYKIDSDFIHPGGNAVIDIAVDGAPLALGSAVEIRVVVGKDVPSLFV